MRYIVYHYEQHLPQTSRIRPKFVVRVLLTILITYLKNFAKNNFLAYLWAFLFLGRSRLKVIPTNLRVYIPGIFQLIQEVGIAQNTLLLILFIVFLQVTYSVPCEKFFGPQFLRELRYSKKIAGYHCSLQVYRQ